LGYKKVWSWHVCGNFWMVSTMDYLHALVAKKSSLSREFAELFFGRESIVDTKSCHRRAIMTKLFYKQIVVHLLLKCIATVLHLRVGVIEKSVRWKIQLTGKTVIFCSPSGTCHTRRELSQR
jgi:hypothetical protein